MPTPAIHHRRDLARHLQAQMAAARAPWAAESEDGEAPGRTSVKTYLIEAHDADSDAARRPAAFLEALAPRTGFAVHETDDPSLVRLDAGHADFWCDTSLGRFWRLHTIAEVKLADRVRDQLVAASPMIDRVWLPPPYLEQLPDRAGAAMQTFSMNHDRRPLRAGPGPRGDFEYVSLRLWASGASEMLAKLRRTDLFPHGISIRSVKVRSDMPDVDDAYCVAEYFHDGKVTASGTSFDEHNRMLLRVLADYRSLVTRFEAQHAIGWSDGEVRGQPIVIEVDWTLQDLEYAIARIFSAGEPFRLWGLPDRIAPGHFRAHAVDLHVGGTISFDFTPRHVIVRLPAGACGNSVVRFLGNLNYHVNSEAGSSLLAQVEAREPPPAAEHDPRA